MLKNYSCKFHPHFFLIDLRILQPLLVQHIDLFDFTLDEDDMLKLKLIDENESKFGWYY